MHQTIETNQMFEKSPQHMSEICNIMTFPNKNRKTTKMTAHKIL
jgi:hypothetical protein